MMIWVILGIIVLIGLFFVLTYNGMVKARNKVDEAWSGIDVQLKRRHDLIPNLFENVSAARSAAMNARGPAQAGQAEGALTRALGGLFAVAEAYPQLRAAESFTELQRELANTEDQIAGSRRIYNGNVQSYNTKIQVFPNSMLAGPFGFTRREFFEIEDPADREPVKVSF